jgi:glycosyltransferase involved in cell wall biosynthesis
MGGLRDQLVAADAVCAISEYGQWQLKEYLGIESTVIYQPIKPAAHRPDLTRKPFYRFAHVGRRQDANKRFNLGALALNTLGYTQNDLCLVGNEPGWGDYLGVLNDENLNIVYNSVDFVFCLGKIEGLSLTPLESAAAGAIPIICNDLTTREELFPTDLFPEYEDVHPTPRSIAAFISHFVNEESGDRMREMKLRLRSHFNLNLKEKVSPAGVARRIESVYNSIT